MAFHIVLVEPEMPQNTGNIARTCAATGAILHLVKPLGFSLDDRYVKRAGLDYWDRVRLYTYDSFEELAASFPGRRFFCATTKAVKSYTEFQFRDGDLLVFGKETAGLPAQLLERYRDTCIRIPMLPENRTLNLSNAAAIVLYEALRQNGFPHLT